MNFILSSIEKGTNALYSENLENEKRLGKKAKLMSKLTQRILASIDYSRIRKVRKENMLYLHNILEKYNEFDVNIESDTHMYYPLLVSNHDIRQRIVGRKIYTPTWWKHVPNYFQSEILEARLSMYMLMIPIDQRYDTSDMLDISRIILEEYRRCC